VTQHRRALVVQRTGWGKSAVYFVATRLLRDRGAGPTVIVSPLLALMRNQIGAADRAGIHARTINSSNTGDWEQIFAEVEAGAVDVLLVSPERLNNPEFRDLVLPKLAAGAGLVVVDEAHCISDWGHDFRPDYRRLRTLLAELPPGIPVLATTATANARVTQDVAEQLAGDDALVLRGPLERDSLHLAVVTLPTAEQRIAWLGEHLGELPGSGIIYTLTVAAAHEIAGYLRDRGYEVAAYSGQTEQAERLQAEQDLLDNKLKALVATSALGMGFDKPDLGFIAHVGAPQSPVAYYQQIGRAGRGVDRAEVILLPGREDRDIWAYFASLAFPPEPVVRRTLEVLETAGRPLSTGALEPQVDLSRTRLEMMLKVLDVDGAARRVKGGWTATGRPWSYDRERYERVTAERRREQQAMLDYISTPACREEYLRRQLDDPGAAPCGRCDNCTGRHRSADVTQKSTTQARDRLHRPGVDIAPRRMWPAGVKDDLGVSGRIELQAETGRALGRLTDIGWGNRLRDLFASDDTDVPADLIDAVVKVLAAWDWPARPTGVVTIGSRSRPRLVSTFGHRIAEIGRLPYLGELTPTGDPVPRRHNSAQRLRSVWQTLSVPTDLAATLPNAPGPVLLVDDRIETGWTMTVATRLLREQGAQTILPLTLATPN
ncbi:MAG: DEAD/DEAH box helicase, partial [Spirillospora sp.]